MYGIGTYKVNSTPCISFHFILLRRVALQQKLVEETCIVEFILYISFKIKMIIKILISIKCENIRLLFTERLSLFILIQFLLPPSYKFNGVYLELD